MGDKSEIQWTDATWNPVTGCSKVSPGCAHCYAESLTARYAGQPGWIDEHRPWTPANAAHNVRLRPERLDQPLRWRRPRMVFVNSMSDLFHEQIPDEYIARVFGVMAACNGQDGAPAHTFQVLTKRPERMRGLLTSPEFENTMRRASGELGHELPLPNVWLGTSIENRRYVARADELRATPAAVRFISAEPLLGPLLGRCDCFIPALEGAGQHAPGCSAVRHGPDLALTGIDWLIVGGESGPSARRCDPEWVRALRDACEARRSYGPHEIPAGHVGLLPEIGGTAFFFKQWGGRTPKAGGRELDGRTWDEMPLRIAVLAAVPAASPDERLREALRQIKDDAYLALLTGATHETIIARLREMRETALAALAAADREAPDEGSRRIDTVIGPVKGDDLMRGQDAARSVVSRFNGGES